MRCVLTIYLSGWQFYGGTTFIDITEAGHDDIPDHTHHRDLRQQHGAR
jgi:hypothetical protein